MTDRLDELAGGMASGELPVDPNEAFTRALDELSGSASLIDDQLIRDAYVRELADEIREKIPQFADVDLGGFFNYAVSANRPVKMRVDGADATFVGVPSQFGDMAEKAGIPEKDRPALFEKLARVAMKDESFSEDGLAAERVRPVGPTPKSKSLKKAFMAAALATFMTLNSLVAPFAHAAPAAGPDVPATAVSEVQKDVSAMKSAFYKIFDSSFTIGVNQQLDKRDVLQASSETELTGKAKEFVDAVVKECQGKNVSQQLEIVQKAVNSAIRYMSDSANWKKGDYWANPQESLGVKKMKGDCEDYAIVKYHILKKLGVASDDNMRIVIVKDRDQNEVQHAVLAVFSEGKISILDNQMKGVVSQEQVRGRYTAICSLNANMTWNHVMSKEMKAEYDRIHPVKRTVAVASRELSPAAKARIEAARAKLPTTHHQPASLSQMRGTKL